MKVNKGETVIDIGCGSGIQAIVAVKLGGVVSATDVNPAAIELSKYNALLNSASIDVRLANNKKDYFASFPGSFDVIVANLPQKLILSQVVDSEKTTQDIGVHGGRNGNELIIDFLKQAKKHMHKNTRIYVMVYSLASFQDTISFIESEYSCKKLASRDFNENELISQNESEYERLLNQGKIGIKKINGTWYATETVYELTLK